MRAVQIESARWVLSVILDFCTESYIPQAHMGIIRLFLALSVVFAHSPSGADYVHLLLDPQLPVECFYIISGFYIAMVYNEHYSHYEHAKRYFYRARYLRLYPSYIVCAVLMLISLIVRKVAYTDNGGFTYVSSWSELVYLFRHMHFLQRVYQLFSNLTMIGYDWANFIDINTETGHTHFTYIWHENVRFLRRMLVPQGWTIGIELTFYLLAPWLTRCSLRTLLCIVAAVCFYKYLLYANGMATGNFYRLLSLAELGVFALGISAYLLYQRWRALFDSLSYGFYAATISAFLLIGYSLVKVTLLQSPFVTYHFYLFISCGHYSGHFWLYKRPVAGQISW